MSGNAISNPAPRRPLLISIGLWCSAAIGALAILVVAGVSFGDRGQVASYANVGGVAWAITTFVTGSILLLIAYAIATERPWSRALMIIFWLCLGGMEVGQIIGQSLAGHAVEFELSWLPALLIAFWYLFAKHNVVTYFTYLKHQSRPRPVQPDSA